ncbi:hypothetical protein ACOSQ2_009731 [Xanthoceras sorbifolium]
MSDNKKRGLSALENEWPLASKRYYFKHMLANFKCAFNNHNLNDKLWHAAQVRSEVGFKEALKFVRRYSVDVVNWLMAEPVDKWTRHAFDCRIKSDHVTNNMSSAYDWIKDERDNPILTLLELLKRKIIVGFVKMIHGKGEWYETLEPSGKKILVNTGDVNCDSGMWQISEIPNMHVVVVFMYNIQFTHEHVQWYYFKEAMKLTYYGAINPIPDKFRWPEIEDENENVNEIVEPPVKRSKVDRHKKARRRVEKGKENERTQKKKKRLSQSEYNCWHIEQTRQQLGYLNVHCISPSTLFNDNWVTKFFWQSNETTILYLLIYLFIFLYMI